MNRYFYQIRATWIVKSISPADLGKRFVGVLDTISEAVPEVGRWQFSKPPYKNEFLTIDEVRANPGEWVENNPAMLDGYLEPDDGYSLIAMNMAEFSPKNVGLTASMGGRFGDSIRFRLGFLETASDLETVTYPLFRAALLAIVAQLPPVWANAYLYIPGARTNMPKSFSEIGTWKITPDSNVSLAPGIPPHPDSSYHRPWLSYLCAPLTEGLTPPLDVPCERTPDGGLLMVAAEERLNPTDPDHMRRSLAMAEVMIARAGNPSREGWWPLDEEWPPTEEALRRRRQPPPES